MTPSRLAAWLTPIKDKISHVQLYFLSGDETADLLQTWEITLVCDMGIEAFFTDALTVCQEDCNELREMDSRYKFVALSDEKANSSRVHRCKPTNDAISADPLGIGANGGNTVIGQLVRMNEAMLRMQIQSWGNVMTGFKQLLLEQRQEINEMRGREREMQVAIQEAVLKSLSVDEGEHRQSVAVDKLVKLAEEHLPGFIAGVAQTVSDKGVPEV